MVALDNTKGRTMNTKLKKLITIALAAAALTTASLGATGEAFAGGRGGGYFHGYRSGFYFSSPASSSCWGWYGGRRIWVCY
jgi:hypothetical protein